MKDGEMNKTDEKLSYKFTMNEYIYKCRRIHDYDKCSSFVYNDFNINCYDNTLVVALYNSHFKTLLYNNFNNGNIKILSYSGRYQYEYLPDTKVLFVDMKYIDMLNIYSHFWHPDSQDVELTFEIELTQSEYIKFKILK